MEDIDPNEIDHTLDRLAQKRLSVELLSAAAHVVDSRKGVQVCEEQSEAINKALENLVTASEEVWPGDSPPELVDLEED